MFFFTFFINTIILKPKNVLLMIFEAPGEEIQFGLTLGGRGWLAQLCRTSILNVFDALQALSLYHLNRYQEIISLPPFMTSFINDRLDKFWTYKKMRMKSSVIAITCEPKSPWNNSENTYRHYFGEKRKKEIQPLSNIYKN